jgi:hypothetical protein
VTATYRVGAASSSGGLAYARYLVEAALKQENERAALYYAGDAIAREVAEPALALRPDVSAAFAKHLAIDTTRHLTLDEFAHLMNNQTANGQKIEGRKKHSAHQSVASVFGLDQKAMPSVAAIENVLAGKRADGGVPRSDVGNQAPLPDARVATSLRKFRSAMGVPAEGEVTAEQIVKLAQGRIDQQAYLKEVNATSPPVGYVDITFSADKSVSISFALEKDRDRRALILADVQAATADALAYGETVLGVARSGAGGRGPTEAAELMWVGIQHYTARPATDVVRKDAEGREYTDTREVPTEAADVNLHQHRVVLSSMRTASGKIRSVDLDRLDGELKIMGAVFHASLGTRLRARGADVALGPNGEARVGHYPEWFRTFNSRRSTQGETSAKEWAKEQGADWDKLDGEERIGLLSAGVKKTRESKQKRGADEGLTDIETWQRDAERAGYRHQSVLNPGRAARTLTQEQRIEVARDAALPLLSDAFQTRAVIPESEVKEIAARGLVASGIGLDAAADIEAVMTTFRARGIQVGGVETALAFGIEFGKDGRQRSVVTTGHTLAEERELIALVAKLAADKSTALTSTEIDQAAGRLLSRNPRIDPTGAQWQRQRTMSHQLGDGGQVTLGIGVAGSGKTSSVAAILVDAWHDKGKTVYGLTVPWRATAPLREAGVDHAVAIEAFIRRAQTGEYKIDSNTVIVGDEVSMIGVRQQLALLRLADAHGARVMEIGDPRQCGAVETPAIDLMCKAIGDENIPKLLTSIRQATAHGREVASLFRAGRADDGIAAMREDGHLHLVAGGPDAVIRRTVADWRQRTDAHASDPDYSLIVMTPTNARVLDIGLAIRADRRAAGEIGAVETTVKAMDPNSKTQFDLPLSVGDKIRTFTRTHDADTPGRKKKMLSANGDVIEILKLLPDGLQVRNAAGEEGRVTWSQMKPWRAPKNDPVRISLGYAVTIDSAQSLTRSDAIVSLPDGSKQVTGYKAYTALSRHVGSASLFVSDAAERKQIVGRQMLGLLETPREADVIRNIGANLSRFAAKSQATDMRLVGENPAPDTGMHINSVERARMSPIISRVMDYADEMKLRVMRAVDRLSERVSQASPEQTPGQGLGMSR